MGCCTTYSVTRQVAIEGILSRLYTADDRSLANALEAMINNEFQNYCIVDPEEMERITTGEYREYEHVIEKTSDFPQPYRPSHNYDENNGYY